MRQNLLRLKAILRVNLNYSVYAVAISGLAYLVISIISEHIGWQANFAFTSRYIGTSLALFFLLPILGYFIDKASLLASGTNLTQADTKLIKRNLFALAGVTWASAGCVVTASTYGSLDRIVLLAAAVGLLSWYLLSRQFIKYVFAL